MGQHVHIAGGIVPVGKDEGCLVAGQAGHVAAGHLTGAAFHVEQLVVLHKVDELRRFGAQLVVHGAGGIHACLIARDGLGVAVLEDDGQVGKGGVGDTGALGAHGHHLLQLGHNVPCHLIPEGLNFGLTVADAVHAHIGKFAVILIAQHLGLLIQVLDDLGVQCVQLVPVGVKVTGLGFVGGAAHGGVQILLVGAQLGDGQLLAVQLHQCAAVDLLVLADQRVELLLQLHGAVVHAQHGVLHTGYAGGAEVLGKGIHIGVCQKRPADLHTGVGHSGAVGIKKVLLGFPVGIAGVAGVVDVGQLGGGGVVRKGAALLVVHLNEGVAVLRIGGLGGQLFAPCQQGVDVWAGIGHFAEFHGKFPFRGSFPFGILCSSYHVLRQKKRGRQTGKSLTFIQHCQK